MLSEARSVLLRTQAMARSDDPPVLRQLASAYARSIDRRMFDSAKGAVSKFRTGGSGGIQRVRQAIGRCAGVCDEGDRYRAIVAHAREEVWRFKERCAEEMTGPVAAASERACKRCTTALDMWRSAGSFAAYAAHSEYCRRSLARLRDLWQRHESARQRHADLSSYASGLDRGALATNSGADLDFAEAVDALGRARIALDGGNLWSAESLVLGASRRLEVVASYVRRAVGWMQEQRELWVYTAAKLGEKPDTVRVLAAPAACGMAMWGDLKVRAEDEIRESAATCRRHNDEVVGASVFHLEWGDGVLARYDRFVRDCVAWR